MIPFATAHSRMALLIRSGNHHVCWLALASGKRTVVARTIGMKRKQATQAEKAKTIQKRILPFFARAGNVCGTGCSNDLNTGNCSNNMVNGTRNKNPPAKAIKVNNSLNGQIWLAAGMDGLRLKTAVKNPITLAT